MWGLPAFGYHCFLARGVIRELIGFGSKTGINWGDQIECHYNLKNHKMN